VKAKASRVGSYEEALSPMIGTACESSDYEALFAYLAGNSNLPGPRGNLELAEVFAEVAVRECTANPEALWRMASELLRYSADVAPANDPKEFLPFCAVCALGQLGAASPSYFSKVASRLRQEAEDTRWRTREGVAWGMQRMLASHPQKSLQTLATWITPGKWLAMRAVVAAAAEPWLLHEPETARIALDLHRKVLAQLMAASKRDTAEFRTLRQGLSYSLSVVVQALPQEGFAYLQQLVDSGDSDVLQIVKANLAKKRLSIKFPKEVAMIARRL
jgi:hypothetical protein